MAYFDNHIVTTMLDVAKSIIDNYTKEEASEILEKLKVWADAGTSASNLKSIALGYGRSINTELYSMCGYDEEVSKNISEYYSDVAYKSQYLKDLLVACVTAKRGNSLMKKLFRFSIPDQHVFDLLPYVRDTRWSDAWVDTIASNTKSISNGIALGNNPFNVFTPYHDSKAFNAVAYNLYGVRHDYDIPTDWLKDENWHAYEAETIVTMYIYDSSIDWGKVIKPYTSMHAVRDLCTNLIRYNRISVDLFNNIMRYWDKVTPKLDFVLNLEDESKDGDERRSIYDEYVIDYSCNGDELADCIYSRAYPNEWLSRARYYEDNYKPFVPITEFPTCSGTTQKVASNPFADAMSKMMG